MEDWKECTIGDICSKITSGGTPKSTNSSFYNGDIPWLNTKEVNFNRIFTTEKTITQDGYDNSATKWIPENSVIVAMYGATAGKSAISKIPLTTNQACCNLIVNKEIADYNFLYYHLFNSYNHLASLANGGAQQNLNANQIREYPIKLPPLPTQQKIAQILSSLDDKIELNNKINANLEQQAQALFKSWFVDFEPFGGEMPAGWKVGILSDVAKLSAGGDKPKETSDKKNEVYNIPIYSNGLDNFGLYGFTNKATIFEESVTVSARGTIGFVCLRTTPYVPIVRLVSVIPKCTNVSAKYLYLSLRNKNIAGTGTTQQQLTVPAFSKEDILIPPEEVMISFTNLIQPMFSKIFELRTENEKLSTIRDTLLPKLMNGEVEV